MSRIGKLIFFGIVLPLFIACNQEYNTVGIDLINTDLFDTETQRFPVYVSLDKLQKVQTDQLAVGHLGNYEFSHFGRTKASITSQLSISQSPRFGRYTQEYEDEGDSDDPAVIQENERITEVFLEIPFLINRNDQDNDGVIDAYDSDPTSADSDSDGDGISDTLETQAGTNPLDQDSDGDGILDANDTDNNAYDAENRVYEVDSIYGNSTTPVHLKVSELTYFLNPLDPDNNFESTNPYFSDRDFYAEGFYEAVLFDAPYTLDFNELRFNYAEDDPDTEDDETTQVETRLTPRLRIPLDIAFFQEKIIDQEGASVLANNNNFRSHIKGINIRMDNASDNLYMLLNLNNAEIKINYTFDTLDDQDTEDTADDVSGTEERTFSIPLDGVSINHFSNESEAPTAQPTSAVTERFALRGALGSRARIKLFDLDDTTSVLENIRSTNLLINEANLVFYIDPELTQNWTEDDRIAERLFLYDLEDNLPLADYYSDSSVGEIPKEDKNVYSGILEYQDGVPYRYKFRITEHISNLIRSDDTDLSYNTELGLTVTYSIANIVFRSGAIEGSSEEVNYPLGALTNPLGTLLIGPNPPQELIDKRLQLEIIYTDFNN